MRMFLLVSALFLWAGLAVAEPAESLVEKHGVVALSSEAEQVAAALSQTASAELLSVSAEACVSRKDGTAELDTACLANVGKSQQGLAHIIGVLANENGSFTAYQVRISDGAAIRYATAALRSDSKRDAQVAIVGDSRVSDVAVKLSNVLAGSFGVVDVFGTSSILCLVLGGLLLLLLDAFSRNGAPKNFIAHATSFVGLASFALAYVAWTKNGFPYARELFFHSFSADHFSLFFAMLIGLSVAVAAQLSLGFFQGQQVERGEFYPLLVFAASGMLAMVQATDLFVMFIALEVMSLSIYVLVGFLRHEKRSAEGAMKYFLLGAFSSAFLLYGIALIYGVLGTTNFGYITKILSAPEYQVLLKNPILIVGVMLVLGGYLFKIAAFPFHMWMPDAYQAAPSPVTGFMAFGVKAAAFASMLRAFSTSFLSFRGVGFTEWLDGKGAIGWYAIIVFTAAVTMILGNMLALGQKNAKRMLAYSSIAHAGYLLVGVAAMAVQVNGQNLFIDAGRGLLFYLMGYGFSTLLAFGILSALERRGESLDELDNLKGVARRHPALALGMAIAMLSLAGVPPAAGFFGKLVLFREAIRSGNSDLLYLAIIGVLASVVGVYYYLRMTVVMYMHDPAQVEEKQPVTRAGTLYVGIFAAAFLTLYLGLFPGRYVAMSDTAIRQMTSQPTETLPASLPTTAKR